jgi:PTH2 family peptidyl-tRNA hydrolase
MSSPKNLEGNTVKYKLYCIFAKESIDKMGGNRGKMCAQAGHAYTHAILKAIIDTPDIVKSYLNSRAYKITLLVDTVDQLKELQKAYDKVCATYLVTDAGFTVFNEPTITCLGLGPISEDNIGDDIKNLKVFL